MYVYQQIIFDINIYTQKRSKFRSLYKSVPTVWRRGNKRCREPLSRWRGVHLWWSVTLLPQGETFVLHIKITMDANFFSTNLICKFDGLRLVWEFRSFVFIWMTNDTSRQTLFRVWWMNCWWFMRCSNQIMLQLLDVIGILIYTQVFEIRINIVKFLQQKTVLTNIFYRMV